MLHPLLLALPLAAAEPAVTIKLDRPRYASGVEIHATVTNALGEPIFVPVCETMQVELFDADKGRWQPASTSSCNETRAAVALAEGTHALSTSFDTDAFTVIRMVLAFGLRCRDGYSLDMAGCEEFRAATSTNITVAPEEGG